MDFKIKYINCTYEEFMALKPMKHIPPKAPNLFWRSLAWTLSVSDLKKAKFNYTTVDMD